MSEQSHLVLQLQHLWVDLRHLLVWLVVLGVVVATLILRIVVCRLHGFQCPVEVCHTDRLLEGVFDPFDFSSFVSHLLADSHQLGAQVPNFVLLLSTFALGLLLCSRTFVGVRIFVFFVEGLLSDFLKLLVVVFYLLVEHSVIFFDLFGVQRQGVLLV